MATNAWRFDSFAQGVDSETQQEFFYRQTGYLANDGVYSDISIQARDSNDVHVYTLYKKPLRQRVLTGKTDREMTISFNVLDRDGEDGSDILPPYEYHPVKPVASDDNLPALEVLETAFIWSSPVHVRYGYSGGGSSPQWREFSGGRGSDKESWAFLIESRERSQDGDTRSYSYRLLGIDEAEPSASKIR